MEGTIYITGEIGCFGETQGVQLIDVIQQVKKYPEASSYLVYIDSFGGECDAGFDIYDYLRSLGKPIKTIGVTKVMSIATVIFMAGDQRVLRQGCEFMIHLPSGEIGGTADEIAEYASLVKSVEKRMVDFYKKAINLSEEAITPLLKNETFLTSDQAKNLGFATETDVLIAAKAKLFINSNTNTTMTKDDKSWIEKQFENFENKIKNFGKKVVALSLTAADGSTMVDFADLADGDVPAPGDIATIDGKPAEGEVLMPDGSTFVFAADKTGALESITPKSTGDATDLETANARIAELEGELATALADGKKATDGLTALQKDFKTMKGAITSKLVIEKGPAKKEEDEPGEKRSLLKKKE